ncbi:gamma-butyrobetaine hydroxylase-like domain-containing protein [Salinarimonas chemoclinalis]|uniref:gamma-butyrobetaine hydroxylase-like domain-containing protein n=1 Tax=Salinarimonas chemoclinalis TaxID=3241599 RepID=UPI0035570410
MSAIEMSEASGGAAVAWPTELRVSRDRRTLTVTYDDGATFALPAEYLRVTSPSAEVQGHSPAERKTVPGKMEVMIIGVEPVGNYAVKLVFDDMHDTGIYGWDYLRRLGEQHAERWSEYLSELAAKGMSREPPRRR